MKCLSQLKSFVNQHQRNIIANSFIYSNVSYCPLIWDFCSQRLMNKVENIHKNTLRFVPNDYIFDYETPSDKSNKCTIGVRRLRVLSFEAFHAVNKLHPVYIIQGLFKKNVNSKRHRGEYLVNILPLL